MSATASLRRLWKRPAFIFVVALILRAATGAFFLHRTDETIDNPAFGYEAVHIAQSLDTGNGFSAPFPGAGPTAWLPPVAPVLLAADMAVFGEHSRATLIAAILFNELCSALTIFPVFFAGCRIAGGERAVRTGAIAAWIWALYPPAGVMATTMIWYTSLSGLVAAVILWSTLAVRDSESAAAWIGYGLLWGAEAMTNPSLLVVLPVALLWMAWTRSGPKRLALPAIACIVTVLCCVPWTVRNFEMFHHFVPLRSNFGLELWLDNHDGPPVHPFDNARERAALASLGEPAYMQAKQREAIAWIKSNPRGFARETGKRVVAFWLGDKHPIREFIHRGLWIFKADFLACSALIILVLAGLVAAWRQRREYFPLLAAFPALFPLVYYITIAGVGYRVPIDPVLADIAALGISVWLMGKPSNISPRSLSTE